MESAGIFLDVLEVAIRTFHIPASGAFKTGSAKEEARKTMTLRSIGQQPASS
jgi:hypothetical protein